MQNAELKGGEMNTIHPQTFSNWFWAVDVFLPFPFFLLVLFDLAKWCKQSIWVQHLFLAQYKCGSKCLLMQPVCREISALLYFTFLEFMLSWFNSGLVCLLPNKGLLKSVLSPTGLSMKMFVQHNKWHPLAEINSRELTSTPLQFSHSAYTFSKVLSKVSPPGATWEKLSCSRTQ